MLNWFPQDYQWWITGFNYHMWNPDVHKMYMIAEINFNDSTSLQKANGNMQDMYLAFESSLNQNQRNKDNSYLILDKNELTAYIIWGDMH